VTGSSPKRTGRGTGEWQTGQTGFSMGICIGVVMVVVVCARCAVDAALSMRRGNGVV